ncbi:IclR family transcriptional regulator [Cognatiyoonia sp.]|uniref:IclR family transcriptional regulator n=1 Tax=Cognatiyoonia sp. TaxID=2211652 RepID=UPI003F69646F
MSRGSGDGTVGKALEVLEEVADFGRPVRFNDVLANSRFPKPTLYRLIQTLTNQGMLDYDPDRFTYAPGARLVRLAHFAWRQSSLAQVASPYLHELSEKTGETVHLAQLDSAQVLYLDKRNATQPIEMYSQAGKVGPAYCTGVGKVMLAYVPEDEAEAIIGQQSFHIFTEHTLANADALKEELAEIREHGYGFDREEHEPGIICVAMPILTERGRILGALSVTSTTLRTNLASLEKNVPLLKSAADAIAKEAQHWSSPDYQKQQVTGT